MKGMEVSERISNHCVQELHFFPGGFDSLHEPAEFTATGRKPVGPSFVQSCQNVPRQLRLYKSKPRSCNKLHFTTSKM
jgi:hypothetical protein